MKTGKARVAKWDNLKFILILTVVLGHMFSRYDDIASVKKLLFFIYSFHMPAFVFVSGLFAKKTIDNKCYDKIFSFLILHVVTKVARFGALKINGSEASLDFLDMNDVSWYAFAIFVFCLISIFLKQFNNRYVMTAIIVMACIVGYCDNVKTFLSMSRLFAFYPFFYAGYLLKPDLILEFAQKKAVKISAVIYLLITVAVIYLKIDDIYWYLRILKGKTPYANLGDYASYGMLLRFGWYIYAALFIVALIALTPTKESIFTIVGSRTMQIYSLHYVPMLLFFGRFQGGKWIKQLSPEHYLWLVLLVGILITFLLAIKPVTVLMNAIIYPKKRAGE